MLRRETVTQPDGQIQRLVIVHGFEGSFHTHSLPLLTGGHLLLSDKLLVRLIYEPIYLEEKNSTAGQLAITNRGRETPDFSIEIYESRNIKHILVFEIKYSRAKAWTYLQQSIKQIHEYKQHIISRQTSSKKYEEPLVKFGFLVAPMPDVGIGEWDRRSGRAIPLAPEMSKDMLSKVNNNLREALFSLLPSQDR